ncbi:MAG TPA: hypothetical protein DCE77_10345, partial [Methylophaga sp.]|nr:hypothetical protein [Methylophaga sp.]
ITSLAGRVASNEAQWLDAGTVNRAPAIVISESSVLMVIAWIYPVDSIPWGKPSLVSFWFSE